MTPAGDVLVASTGRTIYLFTNDSVGHTTCTGGCAQNWPPVAAGAALAVGHGVTATLGSITRPDGSHQLTVNGHPVYTFAGDSATGQSNGQRVGGRWFVLGPAGQRVA